MDDLARAGERDSRPRRVRWRRPRSHLGGKGRARARALCAHSEGLRALRLTSSSHTAMTALTYTSTASAESTFTPHAGMAGSGGGGGAARRRIIARDCSFPDDELHVQTNSVVVVEAIATVPIVTSLVVQWLPKQRENILKGEIHFDNQPI